MTGPAYPAARAVAATVEAHFAQQGHAARQAGHTDLAPAPDAAAVEALLEVAFWASLRREEGVAPQISLAWLPPEQAGQALRFARRIPLEPGALARLAPAVVRPEIHLGVWWHDGQLAVWGATRNLPGLCMVLEVVEPGLLVVKHRRVDGAGKFVNVAVLQGDQVRVVDERGGSVPDCPSVVASLLGFGASWADPVDVLVQLAVSMRAHGHGGTLLVVPDGSERWRESVVHPIPYAVSPPFAGLAELMGVDPEERVGPWLEALRRAVDGVAGVTAVDGAAVLTERYALLGFGAKIARRKGGEPVERILVTEPVVGGPRAVLHPSEIGGTRHLSAAQFASDQRDAVALVASQDGRFTVFGWSPCEGMVHAHRVEALLL